MEALVGHGRVKMAGSACGELDDRNTFCPNAFGIKLCFNIAFNNSNIYFTLERLNSMLKKSGFPRSRATYKIKGYSSDFIKMLSVGSGECVVCCKQTCVYVYSLRVTMIVGMIMGMIISPAPLMTAFTEKRMENIK